MVLSVLDLNWKKPWLEDCGNLPWVVGFSSFLSRISSLVVWHNWEESSEAELIWRLKRNERRYRAWRPLITWSKKKEKKRPFSLSNNVGIFIFFFGWAIIDVPDLAESKALSLISLLNNLKRFRNQDDTTRWPPDVCRQGGTGTPVGGAGGLARGKERF